MREYGRAKGTDRARNEPGTSVLAITLGALIIVPALVSIYPGFTEYAAQRLTGVDQLNGWIGLCSSSSSHPRTTPRAERIEQVWKAQTEDAA